MTTRIILIHYIHSWPRCGSRIHKKGRRTASVAPAPTCLRIPNSSRKIAKRCIDRAVNFQWLVKVRFSGRQLTRSATIGSRGASHRGKLLQKNTPRLQETAPPVRHFCMPMNVNHVFDISLGLSFVYSKDKNVNKIFFSTGMFNGQEPWGL